MTGRAHADVDAVRARLGRDPQADYEVVLRDDAGEPVVLRNAPFTRDGTPMPTRYWLVDPEIVRAVSKLEADGGVRAAEAAIDQAVLARAHAAMLGETAQKVFRLRPDARGRS